MSEKPILVLVYLSCGLALAAALVLAHTPLGQGIAGTARAFWLGAQKRMLSRLGQTALAHHSGGFIDVLRTDGVAARRFQRALICTLPGLLLGYGLLWWIEPRRMTVSQMAFCLLLLAATVLVLVREIESSGRIATDSAIARPGPAVVVLCLPLLLALSTGVMADDTTLVLTLHHWTAYIGPAASMRAGGRIFHDFAAQYGLGPTTLLASTCGADCRIGMFWIAGAMSLAFAICMLVLAQAAGPRATPAGSAAVLLAMLAATTFWVSYPPWVGSPMAYPSTGGMRFLPAAMLTLLLVWSETWSWGRHWIALAAPLVALGALWSPEALFQVAAIWGPYCCARRLSERQLQHWGPCLISSGAIVATTLLGPIVVAVALYRAVYGLWPSAGAYAAYVLYPPGPLPVDWRGPIWFVIATFLLGAVAGAQWYRRGSMARFRQVSVVLLLLFAVFSYTLGRSHSNSFLNILPNVVAVLCFAIDAPIPSALRAMAAGMISCVVGFTALFGWSAWAHRPDLTASRLESTSFYENAADVAVLERYCNCDTSDAARAIADIRRRSSEPVTILDEAFVALPSQVWMAFHGPGNYYFMPSAMRQSFLINSAGRYGSSGWVLIHKQLPGSWLEDMQAAYEVTETIAFGAFTAFHLAPRSWP